MNCGMNTQVGSSSEMSRTTRLDGRTATSGGGECCSVRRELGASLPRATRAGARGACTRGACRRGACACAVGAHGGEAICGGGAAGGRAGGHGGTDSGRGASGSSRRVARCTGIDSGRGAGCTGIDSGRGPATRAGAVRRGASNTSIVWSTTPSATQNGTATRSNGRVGPSIAAACCNARSAGNHRGSRGPLYCRCTDSCAQYQLRTPRWYSSLERPRAVGPSVASGDRSEKKSVVRKQKRRGEERVLARAAGCQRDGSTVSSAADRHSLWSGAGRDRYVPAVTSSRPLPWPSWPWRAAPRRCCSGPRSTWRTPS